MVVEFLIATQMRSVIRLMPTRTDVQLVPLSHRLLNSYCEGFQEPSAFISLSLLTTSGNIGGTGNPSLL